MTTIEQKLKQLLGELQFQLVVQTQKIEDQAIEIESLKKVSKEEN